MKHSTNVSSAEVPKQDAKASDAVASGTRLVPLTPKEAPTGAAPLKSTGRDDAHKFELLTAASKNDCERIKLLVVGKRMHAPP